MILVIYKDKELIGIVDDFSETDNVLTTADYLIFETSEQANEFIKENNLIYNNQ